MLDVAALTWLTYLSILTLCWSRWKSKQQANHSLSVIDCLNRDVMEMTEYKESNVFMKTLNYIGSLLDG